LIANAAEANGKLSKKCPLLLHLTRVRFVVGDEKMNQKLVEKYSEIAILHPTYKNVPSTSHRSTLDFMLSLCQHGFKPTLAVVDFTYIVFARNILTEAFVEEQNHRRINNKPKISLALWLDSDHVFSFRDFEKLLESYDNEKADAMSARYLVRQNDEKVVCAYERLPEGDYTPISLLSSGVREVDASGLGFFLVNADALEEAYIKHGRDLFSTKNRTGEDMIFCESLKEMGKRILVNNDVKIGHEGGILYG